jgi:hypothetical protein
MKICSKCNTEKDFTEFYSRKDRPSGYQSACKDCNSRAQTSSMKKRIEDFSKGNKTCTKCKIEKSFSEFSVRKDRPCGYLSSCKSCISLHSKVYHKKNAKRRIDSVMKWREQNPEKYAQYRNSIKDKQKDYQREYQKRKKKEDIDYFMKYKWRKLLWQALRYKGVKKVGTTFDILGYTPENLKKRIECQFKDGMSWNNYGEWEIDHKKPVAIFSNYEYRNINMLCNLQPLWKEENRKKRDNFHAR